MSSVVVDVKSTSPSPPSVATPSAISTEIQPSDPPQSLHTDPERARTESLLQNIDLSVLSGKKNKKKKKKSIQVSVIPPGSQFLFPWLSNLGMTEYESKHQRLHDEIVAYACFVSPAPAEVQARRLIVSAIQAAVTKILKHATVSVFGSVATDLCLPNDDIDLTIIADIPPQLGTRSILHELSSGLRFAQISENSQVISRSRVPLISLKTTHLLASLPVNISVNADTGLKVADIVRDFLDKMPALRPLVIVLKQMLSQCGLDSEATYGLSTYSLTCMVISFLQVNPKERSTDLIENPMENESLGTLLLDFLFYYTNTFDYATARICVTSPGGKVLDKPRLENTVNSSRLSISCLVNPDNEICRPTMKLERLISAFRDALNRIDIYPFSIWHNNCLGTIIGIPQSILDRRERVSQLVISGSMESQINRSITYMAKINPVFYPQKFRISRDNNSEARLDASEANVSSARWYDSYRPDYRADDSGAGWNGSNKRKRHEPGYKANCFGPRALAGSSREIHERDQSRSMTRGSSDRSRSRGHSTIRYGEDKTAGGPGTRGRNGEIKRLRRA